jgi:hypothetical protein
MLLILRLILELRHSPVAEGQFACSECVAVYGGDQVRTWQQIFLGASEYPSGCSPAASKQARHIRAGRCCRSFRRNGRLHLRSVSMRVDHGNNRLRDWDRVSSSEAIPRRLRKCRRPRC